MTVINIFTLWQRLMTECNVQQGGQIRPVQDFTNWLNAVSDELFREKIASAALNQLLDDDLSPFLKSANVPVTTLTGQPFDLAILPTDYSNFANMKILRQKDSDKCCLKEDTDIIDGTGKSKMYDDPDFAQMRANFAGANLVETLVQLIDTQNWTACMGHDTKGPTYDNPKATLYNLGFKVAPKGMQIVVLDYYTTPVAAVFGYTIGTGDIVVYDVATSTQLQWASTLENEFLTRLKKKYALAVGDMQLYQAAENDKKTLV